MNLATLPIVWLAHIEEHAQICQICQQIHASKGTDRLCDGAWCMEYSGMVLLAISHISVVGDDLCGYQGNIGQSRVEFEKCQVKATIFIKS